MSVRWWAAGGGVILLAALAAGFYGYRMRHAAPAKVAPVVKVAPPPLPTEVTLAGTIQATKIIKVGAPVDGTIEQFVSDVGDDVAKGDVLARIRNPKVAAEQEAARLNGEQSRNRVQELDAALIGARLEVSRSEADATRLQLELSRAQKEFERQQMMYREGVTPRLVFEKAEQEYNSLKTQTENLAETRKKAQERVASLTKEWEAAQKAAEKSASRIEGAPAGAAAGELTSPADGVVVARRGKEGDLVTTKITDLFQIAVDLEKLQVVVAADAQTAPRIHAGQTVAIEIKEFPSTAQGTVREVKGGQVLIDFPSPAPGVRPGMTAQVKIKL
ncbi:MAG TPA: efflux RND transporter periplasmic adaptor subunit [Bryobacteraceae bacterium]|nr:efflux RND transporter periplasmic adaptor subunit [Bryobacteraceae bacterium]